MRLRKKLKSSKHKLLLALIFIILCITLPALAKQEIHKFEGNCSMCHLVAEGEEVFEQVFVIEIDFQCKICHNNPGLFHPTGMKPSISMPRAFSLDNRRKVTCATCHKIHSKEAYLLNRGKQGKAFCYLCHSKGLKNIHGGAGIVAHSTRKYEISNESLFVDNLSAQCMSCHDSTLGKGVNIGIGTWLHDQGGSHKIGVDYMRAYSKGGFNHPSLLNENIRLFNGTVGCGTCHNKYSKEPYELVISNKGSKFCLECHRK